MLTHRDARVSLHHAAATAFLYGSAGVADFEAERVMAPAAQKFRDKVVGELDAALPSGAATVCVFMRDGTTHDETILHAQGSIERPMTDCAIESKLRALGSSHPSLDTVIEPFGGWTRSRPSLP